MFLADKLRRLVEDFAVLEDPQDRLATLVNRAKKRPPLPADQRSDVNRVRGCVSVVWLVGEVRDGHCTFRSEAESPLVGALVGFLCEFFSDATATEIATTDLDPLAALDLIRNLSPTRRNGLASALATIRALAQTWMENEARRSP